MSSVFARPTAEGLLLDEKVLAAVGKNDVTEINSGARETTCRKENPVNCRPAEVRATRCLCAPHELRRHAVLPAVPGVGLGASAGRQHLQAAFRASRIGL